ncbi:MAG: hypothetical protein MJK15_00745 [Colwellia sp.]|nr:hypothetical protein [Colwellia sp.]
MSLEKLNTAYAEDQVTNIEDTPELEATRLVEMSDDDFVNQFNFMADGSVY